MRFPMRPYVGFIVYVLCIDYSNGQIGTTGMVTANSRIKYQYLCWLILNYVFIQAYNVSIFVDKY